MTFYIANILPAYTVGGWTVEGGTVRDGNLYLHAGGSAVYTYEMTGATVSGTAHIVFPHVDGVYVFYVRYDDGGDDEQSRYASSTMVSVYDGGSLDTVIGLLEASDVASIYIRILCLVAGSTSYLEPTQMYLEQPSIESVDVEYNLSTSATEPNGEWESGSPQWADNVYIWQRVATTFSDGHTEYSAPVLLQTILGAGILSIEEQYYLSTSDTECVGGTWVDDYVTWQEGCYIWCRSYITYTNQSTGTTEPVLARGYNSSYSDSASATSTTVALDEETDYSGLGARGIFNRLTNNGTIDGLFYADYDGSEHLFVNATEIHSGIFYVTTDGKLPEKESAFNDTVLFYASKDSDVVKIGGFWVSENSLYYGVNDIAPSGKDTQEDSIYIGADGISISTFHDEDTPTTIALDVGEGGEGIPGLYAYKGKRNVDIGELQLATTMGKEYGVYFTSAYIDSNGNDAGSISLCTNGDIILGPYSAAIGNIVEDTNGHTWYYGKSKEDVGIVENEDDYLGLSVAGNSIGGSSNDYHFVTSSGINIYEGNYIVNHAASGASSQEIIIWYSTSEGYSSYYYTNDFNQFFGANKSWNTGHDGYEHTFRYGFPLILYYSGVGGTFGRDYAASSGTIVEYFTTNDLIRVTNGDNSHYICAMELTGLLADLASGASSKSYSSGTLTFKKGLLTKSTV